MANNSDVQNTILNASIDNLVDAEYRRARKLYPTDKHRVQAMNEEVGELNKAILDYEYGKKPRKDILKEGIQAIAMIKRLILEGDSNNKFKPFNLDDFI